MTRKHTRDRVVLGVDPSLTDSGWAVVQNSTLIARGRIRTNARAGKSGPSVPEAVRYVKIAREFQAILEQYSPDDIAMEHFETMFKVGGSRKKKAAAPRGSGRLTRTQVIALASGQGGAQQEESGNPKSAFLLKGAQAVLQHTIMLHVATHAEQDVRLFLYTQPQWKKGKANRSKAWALERARAIYQCDVTNDNEADAIMIAHHHIGLGLLRPDVSGISLLDWSITDQIRSEAREEPEAPKRKLRKPVVG